MINSNLIVVIFFVFTAYNVIAKSEKEDLTVGFRFQFHSEIMGEENTIFVSLPPGYNNSTREYPLILFLDGRGNYQHTFSAVRKLTKEKFIESSIVVGIETSDRNRDFLPIRPRMKNKEGGANDFLKFIKEELIPFIDSEYRTNNQRTLIGHSFGGVFVLHTLMTQPESFNRYLAISPSCWFNNKMLISQAKDFFGNHTNLSERSLFITVGNEGPGMGVREYAEVLKSRNTNLNWHFDEYPDESHGSVSYLSTWNGLRYLYQKKNDGSFSSNINSTKH